MRKWNLLCLVLWSGFLSPIFLSAQIPSYPLTPILQQVKSNAVNCTITPTRLNRADYLKTVSGIVNFFQHFQQPDGRIIDPYLQKEFQYATPCYAWAAASLVSSGIQTNLTESAAQALECAVKELADNTPAMRHGDFFTFPCVFAYEALRERIPPEQRKRIEDSFHKMNPDLCYSDIQRKPDAQVHNWNIVGLSGEFLRSQNGFTDLSFVEKYLQVQRLNFTSLGLYRDPSLPMAYDHFPRHFLSAILQRGYDGAYRAEYEAILEKGAWTSLLMQSPNGELPTGGRSAQHQWNEAEQCVTYEVWADRYQKADDTVSAHMFKRAAHLALQSIQRWVRPSGELFIVKNHFDPAGRHGFEGYSSHSQYNLLAASMMATAWSFADDAISEAACPADVGGFAFELPEFHKVFANAAGLYVEIDTAANPEYNSTGLLRIHKAGIDSLVGPTDSAPAREEPLCVGVAWCEKSGWQSVAGLPKDKIKHVTFKPIATSQHDVRFRLSYEVESPSVKTVTEEYVLNGDEVKVISSVTGRVKEVRACFPALTFDGRDATTIAITNHAATVALGSSRQNFIVDTKLIGGTLHRSGGLVSSRNGFLQAIVGETKGKSVTYRLRPERVAEAIQPSNRH